MHRWSSLDDVPADLGPTVATLGNFDGVHRGHRAVIETVTRIGAERGLASVAVTFDPHPVAVLHPERAPAAIASLEHRLDLLEELGLDGVVVIEFTREYARLTPEDFVRETFVEGLRSQVVVVGEDTRFGLHNSGDITTMRQLGERHGFEVVVQGTVGDHLTDGLRSWSSSALRVAIAEGNMRLAADILDRPHRVSGVVVHGHKRGRELGYPTANLSSDSEGLVPADGVYAGWLERPSLPEDHPDRRLPAAISVGTNPTFDDVVRRTVEAYVLDRTDLDLYGEQVRVDFVQRLRDNLRFDSIEALLEQMATDVDRTRELLG
ncbi:bifunctional riboflavin kinase/FAD synthetase [Ornithinimicrobium humiphilum]|uniref:Riboflavin biosynthesis protein n=1 Tax=Ornithinimicrobium humiphilum TaxID=125288 RepID=A0A543KQ27_9MICO|nr:bifunctional riboflavin kinase/FAD synthetase [Ornithinimicrobium humiphilum]TQM97189.1 riboflavin kinase/FMN adenylyltransferase [Ornithinimicrobium humiphilum]